MIKRMDGLIANNEGFENKYTWLKTTKESLDDWIAEQMQNYVPNAFPVLSLDLFGTDSKVFASFDRAMARRNELLQLQGQAYMRALQYDYAVKGRELVKSVIQNSTRVEETNETAEAYASAAAAFGTSDDSVGKGFSAQSAGMAAADRLTNEKETNRRNSMNSQAELQTKYENDLQALHDLEHGPFDYAGRYKRLRALYLNDYKSFVDAVHNYVIGAKYYGIAVTTFPDYRSPDFIWGAGEEIQVISRKLYHYRLERVTRQVVLSVGWTSWKPDAYGDLMFQKEALLGGIPSNFLLEEYRDLMVPRQNVSVDREQAPWVRLCFGLGNAEMFKKLGSRFDKGSDFRIQAVGVQWIVTTPDFEQSSGTQMVSEYKYRNVRAITVPTVLWPPKPDGLDAPPGEIQFPTAGTTDDGVDRVVASSDALVVGRSPFGRWTVDIGRPLRQGSQVKRLINEPSPGLPPAGGRGGPDRNPEYPNICGLLLHLTLSAKLEE